jgi:hypothetical protein
MLQVASAAVGSVAMDRTPSLNRNVTIRDACLEAKVLLVVNSMLRMTSQAVCPTPGMGNSNHTCTTMDKERTA